MLNTDVKDIKSWSRTGNTPSQPRRDDPLDVFGSEHAEAPIQIDAPMPSGRTFAATRSRLDSLVALTLILIGGLIGYLVQNWRTPPAEAASATLTIESDPSGVEVLSAGGARGKTPLTLSMSHGEHTFEITDAGRRPPFKVIISAREDRIGPPPCDGEAR